MEKYATRTVGLDIGDKSSLVCVIDPDGEKVEEGKVPTTKRGVTRYFEGRPACVVVLEAGTHSPWISKLVEDLGHEVLVANARSLPLIYKSDDKSDENDAERLARLGRFDRKLLKPVKHRGETCQAALATLHARDALVRARTLLVNYSRGTIKSMGERLRSTSAASFHKLRNEVPESRRTAVDPVMAALEAISEQIKHLESTIQTTCLNDFTETSSLLQVPGVGPITALTYVTALESPERFKNNRCVAGYLGLRPRRAKSADKDPQLRITKAGNPYLRKLLVGSAHYILGPFGADSDLRTWGLKLAERGGKNAKKRAVIAVARKLAVLLLALWRTGATYRSQREARPTEAGDTVN